MKLFASAVISLACFTAATSAHAALCAYAVAEVDGEVMAHPAVVVLLSPGSASVDPVMIHVDPTTQDVLGYSLATPDVAYETDPVSIFIPGVDETVEQDVHPLADLGTTLFSCAHAGVTTPAVPIYIPASALQIPGSQTTVPAIAAHWLGQTVNYPATVIKTDGHTIYVPSLGTTLMPITMALPDQTIAVKRNLSIELIPLLEPLVIGDPPPLPLP